MPGESAVGLVSRVQQAVDDPSVAAVAIEHDLTPMAGPAAPVASPTYPGDPPSRPVAEQGFLPQPDESGWLTGITRDDDGRPVTTPSVVLDSVASQSGRAEEALWRHRDVFGGLPGFLVSGSSDDAELAPLLDVTMISSWQVAHRHVDAWIKYADDGAGKPLWTMQDSATRALLMGINTTTDATTGFQYAPNSLLYGFWLSAGAVQRHRQARVYSSEIVGYGAREHQVGSSKVDGLPVSNQTSINAADFGVRTKSKAKGKPSEIGFGPIPGDVGVAGHVCERIAARGSVSLAQLRNIRFADDPDAAKTRAAAVALTILALAGDALARQDTLLRSGCELLPTASRYGFRRIGASTPDPLPLGDEWTDPAWWAGQLEQAMQECRAVGLDFADPVELSMSQPQLDMLADGVQKQLASAGGDE